MWLGLRLLDRRARAGALRRCCRCCATPSPASRASTRTLVEAGRGIGMSARGVLLRIELPLAVPVIMAGVRTALVLLVGTATLVTFINAGGLGAILADRHLPVPVLADGRRRRAGRPARPAHRVARARPRAAHPAEGNLTMRSTAHPPAGRAPSLALAAAAAGSPCCRLRPGHRRRLRPGRHAGRPAEPTSESLDGAEHLGRLEELLREHPARQDGADPAEGRRRRRSPT